MGMALIDGYYKVHILWDINKELYRVTVEQELISDDLIEDFVKAKYLLAYNDIPNHLNINKDFSVEYATVEHEFAAIRLRLWPEQHPYIGLAVATLPTSDCILFKTDHHGLFEFYVFKDMKHKELDLWRMMVDGELHFELSAIDNDFLF